MKIRAARPDDLDALTQCWLEASRVGHPFLDEETLRQESKRVRHEHLPAGRNWVAEVDGRIAGFISVQGGFIGGLFVQPAYHRQGIGRALLEHVAACRSRLSVEVYLDNPLAPAFYRRCGFRAAGKVRYDDYGWPLQLLRR